jgi:hypothetical protein
MRLILVTKQIRFNVDFERIDLKTVLIYVAYVFLTFDVYSELCLFAIDSK